MCFNYGKLEADEMRDGHILVYLIQDIDFVQIIEYF